MTNRAYLTIVATVPLTKRGCFLVQNELFRFTCPLIKSQKHELTLSPCSRLCLRGEAVWQANNFLVNSRNFLVFLVKAGSAESILTPAPVEPRGATSRQVNANSRLNARWRHYSSQRNGHSCRSKGFVVANCYI